jgi:hypothetical protein
MLIEKVKRHLSVLTRRAYSAVVAVGFIASGVGTMMGSTPTWPAANAWAVGAFFTAIAGVLYSFVPRPFTLRLATALVLTTASLRGVGYLLFGPNTASRWAGSSAWLLVAVFAFQAHIAERTAHHAGGS